MADPAPVSGVFARPFTEQVAFFRRKLGNLVPTQRWDDMLGAEHDNAFMVAGATSADLLTDLGTAVDKAISEGRGIEEFRRDFRAIVARNGWTGWTGEGSVKGEAWRVRTILRTNAYTSYSAGRRAQLEAGDFPLWLYRHGGSKEPRPEHLSWDGWAGPPSHPFWTTHYPPSDWGCSCYVVGARSPAGVRRLGGDPDKKLPANWQKTDPRTGAPLGIGRGWNYAPGASVAPIVNAMASKVRNWDHQVTKAFMDSLPPASADAISRAYRNLPSTADDARRYAQRVFDPVEEAAPGGPQNLPKPLPPVRTLGIVPTDRVAQIGAVLGDVDVAGYDFVVDQDAIRHVLREHGAAGKSDIPISPSDFANLPRLLNEAGGLSRGEDPRSLPRDRVVITGSIGGLRYETIWEVRPGRRSLYLVTFYIVGRDRR